MNQISVVNIQRRELNAVDISRPVRRARKNHDREENMTARQYDMDDLENQLLGR